MANPNVTGKKRQYFRIDERDELLSRGYWPACGCLPVKNTTMGLLDIPHTAGPDININFPKEMWWIPVWVLLLVESYYPSYADHFLTNVWSGDGYKLLPATKHYYICKEYPEKRLVILTEHRMRYTRDTRSAFLLFGRAFEVAMEEVERTLKKCG